MIPGSIKITVGRFAKRATGSRVLGCFVAILFSIMTGCQRIDSSRQLFRKHTNAIMKCGLEEERIAEQILVIKQIGDEEFEEASLLANEILEGHIITSTSLGLDQVQRYCRSGPGDKFIQKSVTTDKIDRTSLIRLRGLSRKGLPRGFDVTEITTNKRETTAESLIRRNFNWTYGSSISRVSLPFLLSCSTSFKNSTSALIGVGNGSIARDLLYLGCEKIIGVDLLTDIPQLAGVSSDYLPPEVPTSEQDRFQWLSSVFTLGGDIFDDRVLHKLKTHNPTHVILDIQTDHRLVLEDLLRIKSIKNIDSLTFRRHLRADELTDFISIIRSFSTTIEIGRSPFNATEYWFHIKGILDTEIGSTGDLVIETIPEIQPLTESPSNDLYFNQAELYVMELTHGKCPRDIDLPTAIQYLSDYLVWRPLYRRTIKSIGFAADIALIIHCLDQLMEIETTISYDELCKKLSEIACKPLPKMVRHVQLPGTKRYNPYLLLTRTIPRLLHYDYTSSTWSITF
uniref:RNA-dependent RNA polymerase n=1 Tax=Grapevine-associated mononega-like virus 7 TaxID=2814371 RepID=A0A8F5MKZ2_9MONO|nr:MAG: RNA-dependent RNA polymerase [Grapevine-associated mononega-like virus 7]